MKPIRKTIVNCGVSHVSACVFAKGDDGALILEQTEVEILQYDYSNESLWLDALADGLEKLVSHGIGKGETHFILPGSLLLTKTIRAPRVEESKQRQIVAFELQQKMPYPLAELIWDYQVVEDDGVEQEVNLLNESWRAAPHLGAEIQVCASCLSASLPPCLSASLPLCLASGH